MDVTSLRMVRVSYEISLLMMAKVICTASIHAKNITIKTSWQDDKFQVLNHFWTNTGLSPLGNSSTRANFLISYDEKVNLALIGSVPNAGISHVRIHWIMDLIKVREVGSLGPIFDFEDLDTLIAWLNRHGLAPNFELMGNPSGYFHDFHMQSQAWHSLIKQIISRYVDLHGADYVYTWRFELLNEPDLRMYNYFNFTLPQYLQYFRATESALGKILGPAGLFRNNREAHPLCWGLLHYCNLNPCKLKTVTFHRKGEGVASKIVRQGIDLISTIQNAFPNLTVTYGNSEADLMTGWHKSFEWRSDVRYASAVLQVVIQHIQEMYVRRHINFEILSNDNAFINYHPYYFTQRTLLARFQMNNTQPPHVQFFRKPVYIAMGLLSLLGTYLLDIKSSPGENGVSYLLTGEKYRTMFLATITDDKVSDEVYNVNVTASSLNITIKINLEKSDDTRVCVVYSMDNANNSPYQAWKDGGSPDFPDSHLRRKIRLSEDLKRLYYRKLDVNERKVSVILPNVLNPALIAINICNHKYKEPGQVTDLHHMKVNENEILLLWSDILVKSRCLLTYIVEFRKSTNETFERVNDADSIFLSYHYDGWTKGKPTRQHPTHCPDSRSPGVHSYANWHKEGPPPFHFLDPLIKLTMLLINIGWLPLQREMIVSQQEIVRKVWQGQQESLH